MTGAVIEADVEILEGQTVIVGEIPMTNDGAGEDASNGSMFLILTAEVAE